MTVTVSQPWSFEKQIEETDRQGLFRRRPFPGPTNRPSR
ncbi:MAG: hypothetical protein OJF47_001454 [Nitrospira sp.]|nr:MAG: hypothetical protein OJF47_001454 [Nitrospira sp.]